jgi:Zn-dependent protease
VAYLFGDNTALYQNRLTLNPLPHVDPIGSVVIPVALLLSGSPLFFGWAKPVPVSEHNLNPYNFGRFCVSVAGVFVNFLLAFIFIVLSQFVLDTSLKTFFYIIAITNVGLGVFNLLPFPPADGYRVLETFLPWQVKRKMDSLINQNFLVVILVSIFFATFVFRYIFPFIQNQVFKMIF